MPRVQTADDVVERLRQRLAVPVLPPWDFGTPMKFTALGLDGRPQAGGERGVAAYLRSVAPEGYVQVYDPEGGITAENGWADQQFLTIHTVALSRERARALANQVRAAIGGDTRRGGNLRVQLPPQLISNPDDPFHTVVTQYRLSSAFVREP